MRARSLERPQYVYVLEIEYDYRRSSGIDRRLSFFDTYNDGWTQHSHNSQVPTEWFGDCLASILFQFFHKPAEWDEIYWLRDCEEGLKALLCMWPAEESEKKIEFAFSIKEFHKVKYVGTDKEYVVGPWYYNLNECKLSASHEKNYDKRWTEVPRLDGSDGLPRLGSPEAVFRILRQEYSSFLENYALYVKIRAYASAHDIWTPKTADEYFNQPEHSDSANAFRALNAFVRGCEQKQYAERCLRCVLSNGGRDEETGEPFKCGTCGVRLRYREQECAECKAAKDARADVA